MTRMLERSLALLACSMLGLPMAHAEVKDAKPSGFTLENTARVSADALTTWKALVDDVGRWWPRDHTWWGADSELTIEPRAGGCFCERNGPQQAAHLVVAFVDPGKLLRMTGGLGPLQSMGLHGVLEFRLTPADDGGTTITLFYRAGGYTPDDVGAFAPIVDQVQAQQLGGLVRYVNERGAPAAR